MQKLYAARLWRRSGAVTLKGGETETGLTANSGALLLEVIFWPRWREGVPKRFGGLSLPIDIRSLCGLLRGFEHVRRTPRVEKSYLDNLLMVLEAAEGPRHPRNFKSFG